MIQNQNKDISQSNTAFLLLALLPLLFIRLLPVLSAPLSTYGYDFGFYYYAANQAHFSLADIYQVIWGGFDSPVFIIGKWLHLPAQLTLVGSYFLASVFLGLCLYLLMGTISKNRTAGIFAVLLLTGSMVQSEAYTMFLWKNILALPFLILGFQFLVQKKWRLFIVFSLMILLLHRTTAIIYFLTAGLYLLWLMIRAKNYRAILATIIIIIVIVIVCFYSLPLKSVIFNLLYNNNYYVRTGLFLENQNWLDILWPTAILAIAGLILYVKNKQEALLIILGAISLFWIVVKLPFYHRILIYLDLAIICFAAYFLSMLFHSPSFLKRGAGGVQYWRYLLIPITISFFLFLFYRSIKFVLVKPPLISRAEILELKNFNAPSGFVLVVSANDAPWVLAYVQNQRLGAPGLLESPHTYEQWMDFWAGNNQRLFLSNYPRPLYFYQRSYRLNAGPAASCQKSISQNFSTLDFPCIEKTLP